MNVNCCIFSASLPARSAIHIGYVGKLRVATKVIPIPFNQAGIASASHPLCGGGLSKTGVQPTCPAGALFPQTFTYGYSIVTENSIFPYPSVNLPDGTPYQQTFEGGNVDLRVPYIGYSSESESYNAEGVSGYNALQAHVEKRLSHGLQVGFSYTYSHSLDDQSALGLFYNGNNPLDVRSAYGNSDFDRTHVINFTYTYSLPNFAAVNSWEGRFVDGWGVSGLTILQSGQPYSVIDYTGAVGSIFYGVNDGIINPVVPLAAGRSPKSCYTGHSGVNPLEPALDPTCFTLPLLAPGATVNGVAGAIPSNDPYETNFIPQRERNIFRQPWQKRGDISIIKTTRINERVNVRYSFDVFNVFNTPSFDIPIDNVDQNINFQGYPVAGQPSSSSPCDDTFTDLYVCPSLSGLGVTNKTIGSSRQIQMSLSVIF